MGRIIKAVLVLAILGLAGLTAFAYFGELQPEQSETRKPVVLDAN